MTTTKLLRTSLVAAAMLFACGGDDDGSTSTTVSSMSNSTTDPTDASTSSGPTSMTDATMTEPATMTDPGSSSEAGSSESGVAETAPDTSGGTGGDCPAEPNDDECSTCTKMACCPELMECTADPDCDCAVQCISDMGIAMMQVCLDMCMLDAVPDSGNALLTCVASMGCLAACG